MLGDALKQLAIGLGRYVRFHASMSARQQMAVDPALPLAPLKLDLGCGKLKQAGFLGIDRRLFNGVDGVTDLTKAVWVFDRPSLGNLRLISAKVAGQRGFVLPDNSVGEVYCSHFLEHLEHNQSKPERVRFMNELWRVLVPGGRAKIITPHWASNLAYGDFTHADKPVSEWFYNYLDKQWRTTNAPDNDIQFNPDGYFCDFTTTLGRGIHPEIATRGDDEQRHAINWFKEAIVELHANLVARK